MATDIPGPQSRRLLLRRATLLGTTLLLAAVLAIAVFGGKQIDPAELARRCREYAVTWPDYQENIKAIDARAVAQWHGDVIAVEIVGEELLISFRLAPPWSEWEAFLPVLIRTPDGSILRNASASHEKVQGLCRYRFNLGPNAQPLPWIELHYPHVERHIYLDAHGAWRA